MADSEINAPKCRYHYGYLEEKTTSLYRDLSFFVVGVLLKNPANIISERPRILLLNLRMTLKRKGGQDVAYKINQ